MIFSLEFLEEGEAYENLAARAEELSEDEMLFLRVMDLKAEINGHPLDLSACTVEVDVTLSQEMMRQLAAFKESQALGVSEDGTADGEGAVDGDGVQPVEPSLTLVAFGTESDGQVTELASAKVSTPESAPANGPARAPRRAPAANTLADTTGNPTGNTTGDAAGDSTGDSTGDPDDTIMTYSTPGGEPTALSLLMNVYPVFTVEYYAWIKEPDEGEPAASTDKNPTTLSFIDTSAEGNSTETVKAEGPVLPKNGTKPTTKWLKLNTDGTICFKAVELKQVYKDKKFQFNPNKEELTIEKMFGMMENSHYDISELWVLKDDVDFEAAEKVKTAKEAAGYWDIYSENLTALRFTNNPKAASDTVIPISSKTRFRLVYTQRTGTMTNDEAVFYDYDITDGTRTGDSPIKVKSNR